MTASVQDVATQLGRPIDDEWEIRQVKAWLGMADIVIRSRYPNLDRLIDDGRIGQETVNYVEAIAVARYARNPEGTTSKSNRIDDYQETVGTTNARATIMLLDEEWQMLEPKDSGSSGAFTITPSGWRSDGQSAYGPDGW